MTKLADVRAANEARDPASLDDVSSETLFGGRRRLVILHRGVRYVLQITRHGKLILNKGSSGDDERNAKP